jgi:hypothetical protein
MSGDVIASLVGLMAALVLAWGRLRGRPASSGNRILLAVVWLVIILAVVFAIHSFGLRGRL